MDTDTVSHYDPAICVFWIKYICDQVPLILYLILS